ncbi:hypothetical protein [Cellulomonas terrae]|uniref:Uncharacterized protein n=1 Tax=Cellulomonas terrae TaxID=311234 RepID=A0A511JQ32_9CELL|nr:hypothetical protein [Cellulomonas terrae]GEM00138.1 hypothetical protein CTE05_36840 [Cellulomonas terrae]
MKAAYLVSLAPSFEDDVWRAAATLGADVQGQCAQFRDDEDHSLTIFGDLGQEGAWEWQQGPFEFRGTAPAPDLSRAAALSVECRWEDLFASWVGRLAALLPAPSWVVDGDGVVWPATQVDPVALRL